jgi:3-phenylpropionate/cinnamic acid dioxygenase small subunit
MHDGRVTEVEVGADTPTHLRVARFLTFEANLLDEARFDEWLGLFTDDVQYRMPLRTTRSRAAGPGFEDGTDYFCEDAESLAMRVRRLQTDFAWAEDPPSRTRRFVTNIDVEPATDDGVGARSNVLVYRTRGSDTTPDLFSCARRDVLRDDGARLRIARRTIHLDQTVLGGHNLSIFF